MLVTPRTAHRDLALVLSKRKGKEDVQRALSLLCDVIQGEWDIRFIQCEVVAMMVPALHNEN